MLMVPVGGDGIDAVDAGVTAANEVSPPPPPLVTSPPNVPPIHTSSSTSGPSTNAQDTPVRDPTPMREPTPSPMSEPTTFQEPTPEQPRPSPPSCLTMQPSFPEDISEDGSSYVSLPKSNEASPTIASTPAAGAEDSVALTDLSLKLDRCINRVTTLENELGVTKKVLGGEEVATKEQEINLDALHELASTSLGGETTVEAAYTIYKDSYDAHASTDAGHDEDKVLNTTTMPFRYTMPTGAGILADAQTIHAGSTPIPPTGGVSTGSSMDPAGQASTAAPTSSAILAADKVKALMVDDFIHVDLLTKQERVLKNLHDYQLREDLEKKLQAEQEAEFTRPKPTLEAPSAKRARQGVPRAIHAASLQVPTASSQVPAGVTAAPSIAADVLVSVVSTTTSDVSAAPTTTTSIAGGPSLSVAEDPITPTQVPPVTPDLAVVSTHADTEVHADESRLDDNKTAYEQVSTEHTVDVSTTVAFTSRVSHARPSSSRKHRKHVAKKRVTPIVDVANNALIIFDSASKSDGDPSPYAPYAGWEILPTSFGSIYAYYDMEEHTKHFTSLRELLHMMEKNDLKRLLVDVDKFNQKQEPKTFETMDRRVIYMFVVVSYPLNEATLERMLRHGLEVLKLLVGGDLTMAEQLSKCKRLLVKTFKSVNGEQFAKNSMVFNSPYSSYEELASPEQTAVGKDISNSFMAMMICQKALGYFSSPMIHVLRAGLVIHPPG
nr:hypothetical protein [Tanacetum cinerariifolium]